MIAVIAVHINLIQLLQLLLKDWFLRFFWWKVFPNLNIFFDETELRYFFCLLSFYSMPLFLKDERKRGSNDEKKCTEIRSIIFFIFIFESLVSSLLFYIFLFFSFSFFLTLSYSCLSLFLSLSHSLSNSTSLYLSLAPYLSLPLYLSVSLSVSISLSLLASYNI